MRTRTHYDFVVRLRDDAFVYAPWRFKPRAYAGAFVALPVAGWGGGLNDHAFVADRSLADAFFSHVLEDYYLDNNVSGRNAPYVIRNTERMLRSVAQRYSAPVALLNLCDLPAITIKYADDPRVWRTDETYVEIYEREMSGPKEQFYRTLCPDHLPALRRQSYPRMPPDTGVACGPAGGG